MLGLTELPKELFELKHLRGLSVGAGWLDASGELRRASVDFAPNRLSSALGKFADFPDLRQLWLRELDLDTLSPLEQVCSLRTLDCSGTRVSDLAWARRLFERHQVSRIAS